jgi:hypothetical protein
MKEKISWSLMGMFGLMLIVIGFQGSLGKILGCILTPSIITVNTPGNN